MLKDEPEKNIYSLELNPVLKDAVYAGRIRHDFSAEKALNMWCVSENLRKGAATNSIQIARELIYCDLVKVK